MAQRDLCYPAYNLSITYALHSILETSPSYSALQVGFAVVSLIFVFNCIVRPKVLI